MQWSVCFAELRLYVMVLRQQNKHEAALTVLQGELSALWQDESEKEQLEREILWTLKRWPVINQITKRDLQTERVWLIIIYTLFYFN